MNGFFRSFLGLLAVAGLSTCDAGADTASEPATGSPADEFARMWRAHVAPAVSGPAPQPQIRREGDYEVAAGARQAEAQGTATVIALVAIVGQDRAIGVLALAGRWSDAGYSGSNIYTFDGNGQFSFGTSGGALTGSYRLQGFALTLHFADGDVRQRTLFAASAGEPVTMISVEGDVYARN